MPRPMAVNVSGSYFGTFQWLGNIVDHDYAYNDGYISFGFQDTDDIKF